MDSGLFASHAQILTGRAECDDIHRLDFSAVDASDIPDVLHVWEPLMGYQNREGFNLAGPHRFYAAHDR